jgi:hypothetical protein
MAAKDVARGKALELHVGRLFGGRRRKNGEGGGFDDCVAEDEHGMARPLWVSIEAKAYEILQLRGVWIAQAIRNARGRPWILVQRPKGSRTIYATLDLKYLLDPDFVRQLAAVAATTTNPQEEPDVDRGDSSD